MLTKISNFFVLCIIFKVYYTHALIPATPDLLKHHFPSSLDNGNGEVSNTEIGDLQSRYKEQECLVMCGIFRGRMIEQDNPEKVAYIQNLTAVDILQAQIEAIKTFELEQVDNENWENFVQMEIEGTGLSKKLFHCPPLSWKSQNGDHVTKDYYITASDVDENLPLGFEKVDAKTVKFTAIEEEITLNKITEVIEDLTMFEDLKGKKATAATATNYNSSKYVHNTNHIGGGFEASIPVSVAA